MNRLAELIRTLPKDDVELIKKDLDEGNLTQVIRERIREFDLPQRVCPVCNAEVSENAPFVLYFGRSVRRKARFDGIDCLEYFLAKQKKKRNT